MPDHTEREDYIYDPIRGFLPVSESHTIKPNGLEEHFRKMNPFLRTLLVTDGTVTKFLEAYLWEPIKVERLFQEEVPLNYDSRLLKAGKGEPVILRRILLRGVQSGRVYTYAESLIRVNLLEKSIQRDLNRGRLGMGELLRDRRLETYREIIEFGEERAGDTLSAHFGISPSDSLYFRRYRINVKGKPVILIGERFFEAHFR